MDGHYPNRTAKALAMLAAGEKNYNICDSWALLVLGDLHLQQEDMSFHCQARDDCLSALQALSIQPSANATFPQNDNTGLDDPLMMADDSSITDEFFLTTGDEQTQHNPIDTLSFD